MVTTIPNYYLPAAFHLRPPIVGGLEIYLSAAMVRVYAILIRISVPLDSNSVNKSCVFQGTIKWFAW